ncbi:hypothetical protein C462_07582 [Halorubrum distributum JCM 13916]|uniref:Uncharacterized protein n=2 Tax=Halorubrum distributum TaxID=29283 RepID=M0PMW1_9EURY|nr:hypothetical protein C462_07582 [Halorubrum arcis JCM 13916]
MPSASGSLDSGSIDVEAVDSIGGSQLRPTASAGARSDAGGRLGGDRRVRDDVLAADCDLSAADRDLSAADRDLPAVDPDLPSDRDLPAERVRALTEEVAALEAEVEALEAEVEALEAEVEWKERQRQQVIDNYKSIVAAQRDPDRSSETSAAASATSDGRGLLAAVASRTGRLAAWLRPGRE